MGGWERENEFKDLLGRCAKKPSSKGMEKLVEIAIADEKRVRANAVLVLETLTTKGCGITACSFIAVLQARIRPALEVCQQV
jgi:hypothetical protein